MSSLLGGRDAALRPRDEPPGSPPDFVTGNRPGESGPRFCTHRPGGVHPVAQPGDDRPGPSWTVPMTVPLHGQSDTEYQ